MSTKMLPPLQAGLVSAGILAAAISSSDSYLLISASAVSKNVWQGLIRKNASDKETMWVSRIVLILITIFAIFVATGKNKVIFSIVDFAWAGFGAAFGPLMLFSLFWKRTTYAGAIAGMIAGGAMWCSSGTSSSASSAASGGIYELLPAFLFSCIVIVVVSLCTKKPSAEIQKEFDSTRVKA